MDYAPVRVKVWGDFACFTRPEAKVERVSYDVMTPSAARNLLQSIFWKPQFDWVVREIHVLKPVKFFSILRNEVNSRAVYQSARKRVEEGGFNFAEDDRAQRHTLALRDVAYIIAADVAVRSDATPREGEPLDPAKYRDQFRRRVAKGQFFSAPYLGCREFPAFFGEPQGDERPIADDRELGMMLLDLEYAQDGSGRGTPRFFQAKLDGGILRVPAFAEVG